MISFQKPLFFFAFFSMLFGTIYCFILPPFQSPDEYNHFYKAWRVSEGALLVEKSGYNRLGGVLPESLDSLKKQFSYLKGNYAAKTSFQKLQMASNMPLNAQQKKFIDYPNTSVYAPTAYVPQALAIFIGRSFDCNPLYILYLTRLLNLSAWVLLVSLALRKIAFQNWSMAYIALLPSSVAIAASSNADVITNGLCFYIIAIFFSSRQILDSRTSINESIFKKAVLIILVSINKIMFMPLALLQWIGKRSKQHLILLMVMAVAAALLWSTYAKDHIITYENYDVKVRDFQTMNEGVNPNAQLKFILENPLAFTKILATSFFGSIPATTAHLFGSFGWEKNYLPLWTLTMLIAGFLLSLCVEVNPLRLKERTIIGLVAVFCFLLFAIIMYSIWCPVASPVIDNFGGRYFFVLLMLVALMSGNDYFERGKDLIHFAAQNILIIGNVVMVACILERYYF